MTDGRLAGCGNPPNAARQFPASPELVRVPARDQGVFVRSRRPLSAPWPLRAVGVLTLLLVPSTWLLASPPRLDSFDLGLSAADGERAHRRSSFFRPEDLKKPAARKRTLLNSRTAGAASRLRFSRPFYRVEETTAAGHQLTYYVSEVKYDGRKRVWSHHQTSVQKGQAYEFQRSHITYDSLGRVVSYREEGVDTGRVRYKISRARMTYDRGRLVAFTERGQRNKARYSLGRTDTTYDRWSRLTSYRERGQIRRPGRTTSYGLFRSNMRYDGGQLTSYRETGSKDGQTYTFQRKHIKYHGDRMVAYEETGERGGKRYEHSRSRITYEGDRVVSFREEGEED